MRQATLPQFPLPIIATLRRLAADAEFPGGTCAWGAPPAPAPPTESATAEACGAAKVPLSVAPCIPDSGGDLIGIEATVLALPPIACVDGTDTLEGEADVVLTAQ
jgi:hypothetical protein